MSWNRVNEPEKVQESHDIAQLLVEAGAVPTIPDGEDLTAINLVAGYRVPDRKYSRDHSNGCLHQLMLVHIDDPTKLDDTMKWQGKGCYGYTVERTDRKLSLISREGLRRSGSLAGAGETERYHEGQALPGG